MKEIHITWDPWFLAAQGYRRLSCRSFTHVPQNSIRSHLLSFFFLKPKIKRCPSRLGTSAQPARDGLTEKAARLLCLVARGRLRALGTGSETRTWRLYRAHMLPAPTWSLCRQERHVGRRARLWSDPPNDTSGKEQLVPRFPHLSSSGKWYSRAYRGPASWVRDGVASTQQLALGLTFCLAEARVLVSRKLF